MCAETIGCDIRNWNARMRTNLFSFRFNSLFFFITKCFSWSSGIIIYIQRAMVPSQRLRPFRASKSSERLRSKSTIEACPMSLKMCVIFCWIFLFVAKVFFEFVYCSNFRLEKLFARFSTFQLWFQIEDEHTIRKQVERMTKEISDMQNSLSRFNAPNLRANQRWALTYYVLGFSFVEYPSFVMNKHSYMAIGSLTRWSMISAFRMEEVKEREAETTEEFEVARKKARRVRTQFEKVKTERYRKFQECFEPVSQKIDEIYKVCLTSSFVFSLLFWWYSQDLNIFLIDISYSL